MDELDFNWVLINDKKILDYAKTSLNELSVRLAQVEKLVLYPNTAAKADAVKMKEQSAQAQAMGYECAQPENLYAPLRTDTGPLLRLAALARRLLDPHDLGHAVTQEVRDLVREALGLDKR